MTKPLRYNLAANAGTEHAAELLCWEDPDGLWVRWQDVRHLFSDEPKAVQHHIACILSVTGGLNGPCDCGADKSGAARATPSSGRRDE